MLHSLEAVDEGESLIKTLLWIDVLSNDSRTAEIELLLQSVAFFIRLDRVDHQS